MIGKKKRIEVKTTSIRFSLHKKCIVWKLATFMFISNSDKNNLFSQEEELLHYRSIIEEDHTQYSLCYESLIGKQRGLYEVCKRDRYFGLHKEFKNWIFREWAPHATSVYVIGEFSNWKPLREFRCNRLNDGIWELKIPLSYLSHLSTYKLYVKWIDGSGERIPAYITRVVQDDYTKIFTAQVWDPISDYQWINPSPSCSDSPLIYEVHIGMSSEYQRVTTFKEFQYHVLPRIVAAGYNSIQLMGLQEHPYYGSFGYHVSNFYAVSSRFGTPDDLKALVDAAHGYGLRVIMDIVHSHAVKNSDEGLGDFAGERSQYFLSGKRGYHPLWDSYCFDYGKREVLYFLLSNCRFWLEEYQLDGLRFDGVTSMLYKDHGIDRDFLHYEDYYNDNRDRDALIYLKLANRLIHEMSERYITIAEDVSGFPGLVAPLAKYGIGFDYRLHMASADYWIRLLKERKDEDWHMGELYYRLTNKRSEEKTINYVESHDQALVGDKTLFFRLTDKTIYDEMSLTTTSLIIDRAIALHKLIRLITLGTAQGGYLTFMGNEWGHPEWIDFPREGNHWSYKHARREWSLVDDKNLKYQYLQNFDQAMITIASQTTLLKMPLQLVCEDNTNQLLIIQRGNYLLIFNFSPRRSLENYTFSCLPGKYTILLDSDDQRYGGFDRQDRNVVHFTQFDPSEGTNRLSLYIPTRTGLILTRE